MMLSRVLSTHSLVLSLSLPMGFSCLAMYDIFMGKGVLHDYEIAYWQRNVVI